MKNTLIGFLSACVVVACLGAAVTNRLEPQPLANLQKTFSYTTTSTSDTITYDVAGGLVEGIWWDAPADANDPNMTALVEWIYPSGATETIASFATQDVNDQQFKNAFETAASAADFKMFPCPNKLKFTITLDDEPAAAYEIEAGVILR